MINSKFCMMTWKSKVGAKIKKISTSLFDERILFTTVSSILTTANQYLTHHRGLGNIGGMAWIMSLDSCFVHCLKHTNFSNWMCQSQLLCTLFVPCPQIFFMPQSDSLPGELVPLPVLTICLPLFCLKPVVGYFWLTSACEKEPRISECVK